MMFYLFGIFISFSILFQVNSSDLSPIGSDFSNIDADIPVSAAPITVPSFVNEFPLTTRSRMLLRHGELTPDAVLEMLRPIPSVQEGLISSRFYKSDGSPIPGLIRVIQDGGGSSTDTLF